MLFQYNICEEISGRQVSVKNAAITGYKPNNGFIQQYIDAVCKGDPGKADGIACGQIELRLGFPGGVIDRIGRSLGEAYSYNEEAYCIETGHITRLYAETETGLIHAISTLKLLIESGLKEVFLFDRPYAKMRAMRFFIPGRKDIPFFKQFVDEVLVKYQYNCVWFEIGGAMEYKRHPRINTEWEKYCNELLAESGTGDRIQHYTYPWTKNAIHPENGGGSYLTQEEMKELIQYCRDRGMQVFPTIPSLSHSDYIVRAYPELNERVEDKYPDTYCPSNPKTYEVMFDIIDEVLEVFPDTEYVNIGHDEVVTIGICERCRDKDPVDLFVGDILKLYHYIKQKGKKVLIDCDKFTELYLDGKPYIDEKGKLCGGLQGYEKGDPRYVPALYTARDRLPEDIIIMDWYWQFNFDSVFKKYQVILCNFSGRNFKNWQQRTQNDINLLGTSTSNFGRFDYLNLQRNGVFFTILFNAHMGWNESYDDSSREAVLAEALKELNALYRNTFLKVRPEKKYITVEHTTDLYMPYKYFYDGDFVTEADYRIGDYVFTYSDGTVHREPVLYGGNISNEDLDLKNVMGSVVEVSGMTVPRTHDGKTWYEWTFEDPHPGKRITDISFEGALEEDFRVLVRGIQYE